MNAADVIGWIEFDSVLCTDCVTDENGTETFPIFGDSETDCFSHCENCETLIPESLTPDGVAYSIEAILNYVLEMRDGRHADMKRAGRSEILDVWHDQMSSYGLSERDEKVMSLYTRIRERESQNV